MPENNQAGIDCINCGFEKIETTREGSDALCKSLQWLGQDPLCPECNHPVTYEDYLDGSD
jgi:hypothetical protein